MDFTHDDILTPLAITVIIDNQVRDPELFEFCQQGQNLFELFELPPLSTEDMMTWFEVHEQSITEILHSKKRNTFILKTMTRFKEDIHVENLYEAMIAVSVADKEYRPEESDLVKSAASLWGYDRPPLKISE